MNIKKLKNRAHVLSAINSSAFNHALNELKPLIDRIIRGLGVKPQSKWVYGMSYEDLFSEALWILYFHILPGYQSSKGRLSNYAAVYLSRELKKRLYGCRKSRHSEVPFEYFIENEIATGTKQWSSMPDRNLTEMLIKSITGELSNVERLLLRDAFSSGRFSPLRDMERITGIDHVTLSRIRKGLVRKILDRL